MGKRDLRFATRDQMPATSKEAAKAPTGSPVTVKKTIDRKKVGKKVRSVLSPAPAAPTVDPAKAKEVLLERMASIDMSQWTPRMMHAFVAEVATEKEKQLAGAIARTAARFKIPGWKADKLLRTPLPPITDDEPETEPEAPAVRTPVPTPSLPEELRVETPPEPASPAENLLVVESASVSESPVTVAPPPIEELEKESPVEAIAVEFVETVEVLDAAEGVDEGAVSIEDLIVVEPAPVVDDLIVVQVAPSGSPIVAEEVHIDEDLVTTDFTGLDIEEVTAPPTPESRVEIFEPEIPADADLAVDNVLEAETQEPLVIDALTGDQQEVRLALNGAALLNYKGDDRAELVTALCCRFGKTVVAPIVRELHPNMEGDLAKKLNVPQNYSIKKMRRAGITGLIKAMTYFVPGGSVAEFEEFARVIVRDKIVERVEKRM